MPKTFKVVITGSVRIQAPLFTRGERVLVGTVAMNVVRDRIRSASDVKDQPAKPLSLLRPRHGGASYAIQKQKWTGRRAVRDWTLSGALLNSFRVTTATEKRIVISPTNDQKNKLAINQVGCEMFAISPRDEAEINRMVVKEYQDKAARIVIATELWRAGAVLIAANALDMTSA
jgi:hypothetical protein